MNDKFHYVCARAIIAKDGRFLIAKRASGERVSPNEWTTPGGKLEVGDYAKRRFDTNNAWYNVLEGLLKREVMEEVGLEIRNMRYLTSFAFISPDGIPYVVVSFFAEYDGGIVNLCKDLTGHAWVTPDEAKEYNLIDGIYEELVMANDFIKGKPADGWKRSV